MNADSGFNKQSAQMTVSELSEGVYWYFFIFNSLNQRVY